jgi:hypothetical protein
VDNIKRNLGAIEWCGMDRICLAQDRDKWRSLVNAVMNLRIPYNAGNLSSGYTIGGLSISAQFHRISQSVSYLVSFVLKIYFIEICFRLKVILMRCTFKFM